MPRFTLPTLALLALAVAACGDDTGSTDEAVAPLVEVASLIRVDDGVAVRLVVRNYNKLEAQVVRAAVELSAGGEAAQGMAEPGVTLTAIEQSRCFSPIYEDSCQEVDGELCCRKPVMCEPLVDGCRLRITSSAQCLVCPGSAEVTVLVPGAPSGAAAFDVVGAAEIAVGGATIEGPVSVSGVAVADP